MLKTAFEGMRPPLSFVTTAGNGGNSDSNPASMQLPKFQAETKQTKGSNIADSPTIPAMAGPSFDFDLD